MSNISSLMQLMLDISVKASRFLSRDYYELKSLQSSRKSTDVFVSRSLDKIRKVLLNELERARPDFGMVCKDFDKESTSPTEEKWIVTLMDGVENFAHSIPLFGMSIAVEEKRYTKPEVICGLLVFPILDEVYFAEKGQGAWHTGSMGKYSATHRLRASERKDNLLISDELNNQRQNHNVRDFGCNLLSCAYVASAKMDYVRMHTQDRNELAAGILLVQEAGGVVYESKDSLTFSNSNLNGIIK